MAQVKKNILFSFFLLCIFILILEVGARCFQMIRSRTIQDSIFSPIYRHYFFLGPSFKPLSHDSWTEVPEIKINRFGFMGEEFDIKKEENSFRILTLGASTSVFRNYPKKLEMLLADNALLKGKKIEVINAAVPAWGSTQNLIRFLIQGIYLNPDVIIYYEAINDSIKTDDYWFYHMPEIQYEKYGHFFNHHSQLFNFVRNMMNRGKLTFDMMRWRRELEKSSTAQEFSQDPPFSTQNYAMDIGNLIALAKHRGIRVMLITMPLNYEADDTSKEAALRAGYQYRDFQTKVKNVEEINRVTREMAKQDGVYLVDAEKSGMNTDPKNFVDLCHLSDEGAMRLAKMVEDELSHVLEQKNQ